MAVNKGPTLLDGDLPVSNLGLYEAVDNSGGGRSWEEGLRGLRAKYV